MIETVERGKQHVRKRASELRREGIDADEIHRRLLEPGQGRGLVQAEVIEVVEAGMGAGDTKQYKPTDLGNAERLVSRYGHNLRFTRSLSWLVWDEGRWRRDVLGRVAAYAKDTVRQIYGEAEASPNEDTRKKIAAHAMRSESAQRIRAMIELARSDPTIAELQENFDTNGWLLNVTNGTIDLQTGELRQHRRDDLIIKMAPVAYDPDAVAPRWKQFLQKIMGRDPELIAFLRRAVGYTLTGVIRDRRVLFLCHGSGANGKSRFLTALRGVLGDYGQQVPASLLLEKSGDAVPTDLARLAGVRFATCAEAPEGKTAAASLIKSLGGGEPVAARFMRRDFFEFTPAAKIWWGLNDKPELRDDDRALWDRLLEVPFSVTIPEAERIPEDELDAMLAEERAGILAWAVQGCLEWQRDGLHPPDVVTKATAAYRLSMNPIGDFIAECCIIDPSAHVGSSELRTAFEAYTAESGAKALLGPRQFVDRLKQRGIEPGKGAGGRRVLRGIGLQDGQG